MTDFSIYTDLKSQGGIIRLLTLQSSADRNATIRCSLSPVELDNNPTFEALSYCWGDTNDTVAIAVCGKPFYATATLARALQGLRYEDRNQEPAASSYVAGATKVAVWLDIESDGAEIIKSLHQADHHWDGRQTTIEETPLAYGEFLLSMFKVRDFYRSSWWTRIWTVQELLLSKDTEFWCRDRFRLSEDEVFSLPKRYQRHTTFCCRNWQDKRPDAKGMSFRDLAYSIIKPLEIISQFIKATRSDRSGQAGLVITATMFRNREATDPRDRLYGFLGMSPEFSSPPIDYTKPLNECYTALSAYILSRTSNLDVLNCVQPPDDEETQRVYVGRKEWSKPTTGLPSWCPDWNHSPIFEAAYRIQTSAIWFSDFDASGGLPSDVILPGHSPKSTKNGPSPSDNYDIFAALKTYSNHIGIGGLQTDTIKAVGVPHEYTTLANTDVFRKWKKLVATVLAGDAQYPTGQTLERAFQRTLRQARRITVEIYGEEFIVDKGEEEDNTFRELLEYEPHWARAEETSHSNLEDSAATNNSGHSAHPDAFEKMGNELGISACGKSFFITEKGYFGMASSNVRQGDGVFILLGGRTPYILRRKKPASSTSDKRVEEASQHPHNFISPAFIEGLMQGEAIDALPTDSDGMIRYPYITVG